jgi:hypothetical protein
MLRISGHEISGSQRGFCSTPETLLSAKSNYRQGLKNDKSELVKNKNSKNAHFSIIKTGTTGKLFSYI